MDKVKEIVVALCIGIAVLVSASPAVAAITSLVWTVGDPNIDNLDGTYNVELATEVSAYVFIDATTSWYWKIINVTDGWTTVVESGWITTSGPTEFNFNFGALADYPGTANNKEYRFELKAWAGSGGGGSDLHVYTVAMVPTVENLAQKLSNLLALLDRDTDGDVDEGDVALLGGTDEAAVNALINASIDGAAGTTIGSDVQALIDADNVDDDAAYAPIDHGHATSLPHVHDKGSGGRMTGGVVLVP